jgi:hypothetical protein
VAAGCKDIKVVGCRDTTAAEILGLMLMGSSYLEKQEEDGIPPDG